MAAFLWRSTYRWQRIKASAASLRAFSRPPISLNISTSWDDGESSKCCRESIRARPRFYRLSAMELWVMKSTRRRLATSATAPPTSEKAMMGRMRANPTSPCTIGWSVRSRKCQNKAHTCICEPAIEINIPIHSSLN